MTFPHGPSAGLDFGATNSVAALAGGEEGPPRLIEMEGPNGLAEVFRSALCFWHDDDIAGGLAVKAGPVAIHEYLGISSGSRFLDLPSQLPSTRPSTARTA